MTDSESIYLGNVLAEFNCPRPPTFTPPGEHELPVVQFLRPDGQRRLQFGPVGKRIKLMAIENDIAISMEVLARAFPASIAVYAKRFGDDPERELVAIATNGPGEQEPAKVAAHLIAELALS